MVVPTQRKSGKVKEANHMENEVEDLEDENEYELSHGTKPEPREPVAPAMKGKRKGKARKPDKLPPDVEAGRLDTFFDKLPTEVIYNIFSFLHPLDLLRVARTNRVLRSHLMAKVIAIFFDASARIWKAARYTTNPPIPKCPSDQTEPQWARLLFTTECSNCSKNKILSIIWAHRLRLCHNCDRDGVVLILGAKVKWTFPDIEDVPSLLKLLPWSKSASKKYYKISEIPKIGAEWTRIKKVGTEKEFEEFTKRRVKEVMEIRNTSDCLAKSWAKCERDRAHQEQKDKEDLRKSRRNEIFARLEALGHNPSDVRNFPVRGTISAFGYTVPLTESRWDMMRPTLEMAVNEAKSKHVERERNRVVQSRKNLAETLVGEYYSNSNIRPAFRSHSCVRDVVSSKMFEEVIQRPTEVSVIRGDFEEALHTVPELAANASRGIQCHLLKLMIMGGALDIKRSPTGSSFGALLLVTATFFCNVGSNRLPYCGVGELDGHCCPPAKNKPKFHCLSYNRRASSAVAALLTEAGLDSNTTAEQMDEMDLLFSCSGCSNGSSPLVMNWREAARHAKTVDHSEDSGWELFFFEEFIEELKRANIGGVWVYPTTEFQTKPKVPLERTT
ncbi:hypothetical protein FS837_003486 [Tulasnella sp. UAMH 9824]|nr:hypothetical protein FS837_003486 [Tulasnella sp. UAMH 9824]